MNIYGDEIELITAKYYGDNTNGGIMYSLSDSSLSLSLDKKAIISAEIHACEKLLNQPTGVLQLGLAEQEIAELKLTLGLLSWICRGDCYSTNQMKLQLGQ